MVKVNDILKLQKKNITCNVPYQHYKPTIEKGMKNTDAQQTFLKRKSKIGEKKYHKYIMFKLCLNSCTCYILSSSNGVDTYI